MADTRGDETSTNADGIGGLVSAMTDRAATYQFLSNVLSENEVTTDFLDSLRANPPFTGTELDEFATSLANADPTQLELARRALAADHSATLLGMSQTPVSPYESVYTSPLHLMMQEARDEVLRAYRENGFEKNAAYHVPEDHVAIELDFMCALADRAADCLLTASDLQENPDAAAPAARTDSSDASAAASLAEAERALNAQLAFMNDHLLRWVPQLADDIEAKATTSFYRGVAQMLRGFIADDADFLRGLAADDGEEA
ncbi:molecular chaperone TorD family protein [bacterium]|nr:molecular chaperone TorD family protein [bacterium]